MLKIVLHRHTVLLSVCLLAIAILISMGINFSHQNANVSVPLQSVNSIGETSVTNSSSSASAVAVNANQGKEMHAVWVPFMSLNMSGESDKSQAAFQKKFDTIVSGAKAADMNTLIVHVHPYGDALYKSDYFPWSHTLAGTQGVDPGYDPLAYMVTAAHKAGLQIHAWMNPLRIQKSGTPSILAENNPYTVWKKDAAKADWVVDYQSDKYYNPAYEQVRKLIADGAKEIAQKYDVDGIQFDDYFYPSSDAAFDKTAYDAYCATASKKGTALSLADWRRANINALVSLTYSEIKSVKPKAVFGISPQGNVENDLKVGADIASWCSTTGYVDYICPQLYVNFENPTLPFDTAVAQWRKLVTNTNIKFYIGLAVYKAGSDVDSGTWKKSSNIITQQVELGRKTKCDGFMFYSWAYLDNAQTKEEVKNVMKVLN